jgi:ribosomal protein S8E
MQYGNSDTTTIGSKDGDLAVEALTHFWRGVPELGIPPMTERLPQFHFIAAEIHNDEFHFRKEEGGKYMKYRKNNKDMYRKAKDGKVGEYNRYPSCPHLHVNYIPWATGYLRGPDRQIGLSRSLEQMNFENDYEDYEEEKEYLKVLQGYRDSEREIMYKVAAFVFGTDDYEIVRNKKKSNEDVQHLDIPDYQAQRELERKLERELRKELEAEYAHNQPQGVDIPEEDLDAVNKLLSERKRKRGWQAEKDLAKQKYAEHKHLEAEKSIEQRIAELETKIAENEDYISPAGLEKLRQIHSEEEIEGIVALRQDNIQRAAQKLADLLVSQEEHQLEAESESTDESANEEHSSSTDESKPDVSPVADDVDDVMDAKRRQVFERHKQKMRFTASLPTGIEDSQVIENDKQYDDNSDDFLPT